MLKCQQIIYERFGNALTIWTEFFTNWILESESIELVSKVYMKAENSSKLL